MSGVVVLSYRGRMKGAMGTNKISVTVDDESLAWLRHRAKLLHGGNLSAAIAEATQLAQRQEALRTFLEGEGVPSLEVAELEDVTREWRAAPRRAVAKRARGKKKSSPRQ
jgi:hypothetical protein